MSCDKYFTKVLLTTLLLIWLCPSGVGAARSPIFCHSPGELQGDTISPRNDTSTLRNDTSTPLSAKRQPVSVWQGNRFPSVLYFPIDKHKILRYYLSNNVMLGTLDELASSPHTVASIDTIEIIAACSPIGSRDYNYRLATRRCNALRAYLDENHPDLLANTPVEYNIIGIDSLGYKILKQKEPTLTQKQLWDNLQYVAIRFKMRDGSAITPGMDMPEEKKAVGEVIPQIIVRVDTLRIIDTIYVKPDYTPAKPKKQLYFALKTNLLYDALLVPNATIEWSINPKWSLAAEGNWIWLTKGSQPQNRWYYRIQMAGVELRRWINSPYRLQGHAVGIYAMIGDYDIRLFPKDETSMGTLSRRSLSAGISYGYSFPIRRKLNIELGAAVGYVGGNYYKYTFLMDDKYGQLVKYNRAYIGPTRVNVSLVWLLGFENKKKIKQL